MNESSHNIYKSARIKAGLKRDPAAEELHIDVRTLDKYESLDAKAPDEVVKQMCLLYSNRYLGYQHMQGSPLGEFLPNLSEETFKCATLTMIDSFYTVNDMLKNIIQIAADGKVTDAEKSTWEINRAEMMKLASSLMAVLLATERPQEVV